MLYVLLALCSSLNHYCQDNDCSSCVQGYPYRWVACVATCPSNSELDLYEICEVTSYSSFIHLNFFNFLDYESSIIDDFYHPGSLSFKDSSRLSPIPTKERGFYFTSTSSLKTDKHWVLAPIFTIDMIIRIRGDGTVIKISTSQSTVLHIYSQGEILYLSILLYKNYSPITKTYSMTFNQNNWFNPYFVCELETDMTTLTFSTYYSLNDYEFFTIENMNYVLGSSTSGFSGFIYELLISNDEEQEIYFNMRPPRCEFNEYYVFVDPSYGICYSCDAGCSTWPWCTRSSSCSTCFSELCETCSGFSFSNCSSCSNVYTAPFCDLPSNCLVGNIYECTECEAGFILMSGVCHDSIYNYNQGSLEPSIQVKFDKFQEVYEIFQSGKNSLTYPPYNNFEDDDPYPVYNRGMYFSLVSYFVSKQPISLGCTFSYAVWVYTSSSLSPIISSDNIMIEGTNEIEISLSNNEETRLFISKSKHYYPGFWLFYYGSISFSSATTSIETGSIYSAMTRDTMAPGYYFKDTPINYYIGFETSLWPKFTGFIYSLTIWNYYKSNFDDIYVDCTGYHAGCGWIYDHLYYFNEYEGKEIQCDSQCVNGCKTWGTCNQCKDLRCSFCSGLYVDCNPDPPLPCNTGFHHTSDKCCEDSCKDCYGPGYFRCFSCETGFIHYGNFCLRDCPSFSIIVDHECVVNDPHVVDLKLDRIERVTQDKKNDVNFTSGTGSSFWPHIDDADPIPVHNRGFYFKRESILTSQDMIFSHNFSMVFFMKLKSYGKLLEKGNLQVILDSSTSTFQYKNSIQNMNMVSLDKWQVILFTVYSDIDGYIIPYLLSLDYPSKPNILLSEERFDDSLSPLILGDQGSSFEGFLWKLQIYFINLNMNLQNPDLCSSSILTNCVEDCELTETLVDDICIACNSSCIFGCRNPLNCDLCISETCLFCDNFETCYNCGKNSYEKDKSCFCEYGYYKINDYECEKCPDVYLEFLCLEVCPLGYKSVSDNCTEKYENGKAVSFDFDKKTLEFQDSVSNVWASIGKCQENYEFGSFSAFQRGIYFSGNYSFLEVPRSPDNLLLFGLRFFICIWVNPRSEGVFLRKFGDMQDLIEMRLSDSDLTGKIMMKSGESLEINYAENIIRGVWKHVLIWVQFFVFTDFGLYVNGELVAVTSSSSYFIDSRGKTMWIGSNSSSSFSGFLFSLEIYLKPPSLTSLIQFDCSECSLCPINKGCISTCNISSFNPIQNQSQTCENCSESCSKGCRNSENCSLCEDLNCLECDSFEKNSCSSCEFGFELLNRTCIKCEKKVFFDPSKKICVNCLGLCDECLSEKICTSCKSHSSLNEDFICKCDKGYYEDFECKRKSFGVVVEVNNENQVMIIFTEKLSEDLTSSDLLVKVNEEKIKFSLRKIDGYSYEINLIYQYSKKKTKVFISFLKDLESQENSLLKMNIIEATLFDVSENILNTPLPLIKKYTKIAYVCSAGVVLGGSFLTLDPNCLYHFLNSVELLTYTLLYNITFDEELSEFLKGTQLTSGIPSFFDLFGFERFKINESRLNYFGITTYMLLSTSGVIITVLFLIVFFNIFAFVLRLCMKSFQRLDKILSYFKLKVYLRYWLQTFLELFLGCLLGITYFEYQEILQILNLVVCAVTLTFQFICLVFLIFCVYKRAVLIEEDLKEFLSRYGELFDEFKESERSEWLFYVIFIFRRISLGVVIVFSNQCYLQLSVSIVFALAVLFIQTVIYIICTQCFKSRIFLYYSVFLEVATIIYYILISVSNSTSYNKEKQLSYASIFVIISIIIVTFCYSCLSSILQVVTICKNKSKVSIKVLPAGDNVEELEFNRKRTIKIFNPTHSLNSIHNSYIEEEKAIHNSFQDI